jgi:hypothetical protein
MVKRRNDSKPVRVQAKGQAKSSAKVTIAKTSKKSTSSKKAALKKAAPKKAAVKKIRSAAALKGWETRRENARLAEAKRARRSAAAKAVWAKRKLESQYTERRKLLDIVRLEDIAADRLAKLEAKEKAAHAKNFKTMLAIRTEELKKMSRAQLIDTMPDYMKLTIDPKASRRQVFEYVKIYEGFKTQAFIKGMEHTSELAGDVMRLWVQGRVYGTELSFLQALDTTRQILMYTQSWEEAPDSVIFGKLKAAYGTPQFESVVEVLSNETGHSQRYLYSLFHSPNASVFE